MLNAADKLDSLKRRIERKIWKDLGTGCWNWTAALDPKGYPRIRFGEQVLYGNRGTLLVFRKVPLTARVRVTMSCKNRKCVNPDHCVVEEQ